MVVCKFFLQGICRFGENCRFEHQLVSENTVNQPFGDNQPPKKIFNPKTGTEIELSTLINSVQNDVVSGEKGRQWLLTCYAPFKEKPLYPGFVDMSFEEVRFGYVEAQKSNNIEQYNQTLQQLIAEAQARYKSLQTPTKEIVQMLKNIYNNELNSTSGSNQNFFSEKNTGFGSSSTNNGSSVFGQNSTSAFGRQNSFGGASIFGQQNAAQVGGGLFGQQNSAPSSIFGHSSVPNTGSVFGQQQSTNNIFRQMNATQKNGNAFGQQQTSIFGQSGNNLNQQQNGSGFGQQTGSIFGQQSAVQGSTNIFANTNSAQGTGNIFGQQNHPQAGNIFGQQNSTQNTGNVFGQQNTNKIFGQQSNFQNTGSVLGQQNPTQNTSNIFANHNNPQNSTSIFGQQKTTQNNIGMFGQQSNTLGGSSIFGQQNTQQQTSNIFGQQNPVQSGANIFGQHSMTQNSNNSTLFEMKGQTDNAQQNSNSVFGSENKNIFNVPPQGGIFGNTQQLNPIQAQSQNMVSQDNKQQPQSSIFDGMSEQKNSVNQNSNSIFQVKNTNTNLPQSTSIFGLPPTNATSNPQRPSNFENNFDAYSKLEDLTEEEIKWFNSDVFDIYKIPEKPPTYEMCF